MSSCSADQIVRGAKLRKATFIVLGTHGRTGLSRLVMGNVAARVVATAPCPVLTVRGDKILTVAEFRTNPAPRAGGPS